MHGYIYISCVFSYIFNTRGAVRQDVVVVEV